PVRRLTNRSSLPVRASWTSGSRPWRPSKAARNTELQPRIPVEPHGAHLVQRALAEVDGAGRRVSPRALVVDLVTHRHADGLDRIVELRVEAVRHVVEHTVAVE